MSVSATGFLASRVWEKIGDVKPVSAGHADVNGIRLYHEVFGNGDPLVLLPGGLTTIGEMARWIEPLARARKVIAVELQGHGHTADVDRALSFSTLGDDVAALLDHLGLPSADLVGHSFGAAAAIRAAIAHPRKVRRLVVISSPHKRSAWFAEAREGMSQVGAALAPNMMKTPTGELSKQWPDPSRFPRFLDKMGKLMGEDYDWSDEIAKLPMPVLLVFADNDSIPPSRIAELFALLGGGLKEPGWIATKLSKSRLAIVPGYSHYDFIASPEVPQIVEKFLGDPMTGSSGGAAAASQVTQ